MTTTQSSQVSGIRPEGEPRSSSGGVKLLALATGFVMAVLDTTVINIAGPTIQIRLGASLSQLTWIVDGYVLTFASFLLLAGGLANRFGAKRMYMCGMGLFTVASTACAVAPTATVLVIARLTQGLGAALFMPSSLSLLVHAFPDSAERGRMLGWWSAIVSTSSGLGPTIGGVMVSAFGWRSIFVVNLPIAVVGMFLTQRYIAPFETRSTRLAVPGHAIGVLALAALSFALIEGPKLGWQSGAVIAAAAVAVVSGAVFVLRERRGGNPVLPRGLFGRRRFSGANAVGFFFNFALFAGLFLLGLFLQHARGATPFQAGLQMLPMTFVLPLANVLYARIAGKVTNGLLLVVALGTSAILTLLLTTISPATPYWVLALAMAVVHVGAGIVSPAMTAVLVDAAGREHANVAGSVLNANRQIGSLVGIAATAIALASTPTWYHGVHVSFLLIGTAYLAAAVCAAVLILRSPSTS